MMYEVQSFIESWQEDSLRIKPLFTNIVDHMQKLPAITFDFRARPGISFSLRGKHENQTNRPLFVLVDIIDDEPEARWLSVCFYDVFVNDPNELGDQVPQGLLGEDARCFDIDNADFAISYVLQRITEAHQSAAKK